MCSDGLFSCIDWALLARCPRHIQSVFNLILDILMGISVLVNSVKRVSADQCHPSVTWARVNKSLIISADKLLVLINR